MLLRHADAAMYHGKKHKGRHRSWWPARAQPRQSQPQPA
jgi:hypothetical protein